NSKLKTQNSKLKTEYGGDLENESISHAAARRLRGGVMPHVPPVAAPVSSSVRLELEAARHAFPEVVITDPRREHGWRVALQKSKVQSPKSKVEDPGPSDLVLRLQDSGPALW